MKVITSILDKLLTSLVTTCVLFFFSFSFMTGKFPPHKSDMKKAFGLMRQMLSSSHEYNEANKAMSEMQAPNMEQIVQLQRLALQRSETSLELSKLMVRFPQGVPSQAMADKLNRATQALAQADQALSEANQDIQTMATEPQQSLQEIQQ